MHTIQKLLVANRGEIACRVLKTAKRLGIATVAVYSSADRNARHVDMADESVCIGAAPPGDSYLNIPAVLEAAKTTGADAIHPGYGFLSENPEFALACEGADIIFVGPPIEAIRRMGQKGVARAHMAAAGVPVLPGSNAPGEDYAAAAEEIGYPLLVKPDAGGGGKGMKVVRSRDELQEAVVSARREAKSAFGSDLLIFEKYLMGPRHIEIQVFGDSHGNYVHLAERDCSLQRRHQKIIEEAPAPGVSDELRQQMGDAAVAAARSIAYVGAGTVEFLLGDDNQFYFMEMNTRLQVEHPVTECITGLDLVEWQLLVAAGSPLPLTQDGIQLEGHAIEARLYAEDPLNGFLPVSGRVQHLTLPVSNQVRIDNGIKPLDRVGVFYDPMLMKLIVTAPDREQCLDRMSAALSGTHIAGIRTNRDFLCHVIDHPPFRAGCLGTDYLDKHLADIFSAPSPLERRRFICAAVLALESPRAAPESPWFTERNFRLNSPATRNLSLLIDNKLLTIAVEQARDLTLLSFEGSTDRCRFTLEGNVMQLVRAGDAGEVALYHHDEFITLVSGNRTMEIGIPLEKSFASEEQGSVQAPMSGRIVAVQVKTGDQVEKGAALAVVEAMKMEHTIRAPAAGIIKAIHFSAGDLIDEGIEILELDEETAP